MVSGKYSNVLTLFGVVQVAVEYSTCDVVFAESEQTVAWIALTPNAGETSETRVRTRRTLRTDVGALLAIGSALRLPEYFHWRNESDRE